MQEITLEFIFQPRNFQILVTSGAFAVNFFTGQVSPVFGIFSNLFYPRIASD
jgi:hypothetical protein